MLSSCLPPSAISDPSGMGGMRFRVQEPRSCLLLMAKSLRNACDASQACRTWEGNLKHNLTTLGDEPSQLDVVSRVRLTPEDGSCTIGGILPCFLGGCATNCPGEGTETPTCLSLYVKEDWVEGGKPTETRKSYFTHKLPIGVTTKAAECPWSEPSMVPGLTGCAGAGLGFASERDLP